MAITLQAKTLKQFLKELNLSDHCGRLSVNIERLYAGKNPTTGRSMYEYGCAVSHVVALSESQIEKLKAKSKYIRVHNNPAHNFAIVKF